MSKNLAGNELYRSLDDKHPIGKVVFTKEQEQWLPMFAQKLAEAVLVDVCEDLKKAFEVQKKAEEDYEKLLNEDVSPIVVANALGRIERAKAYTDNLIEYFHSEDSEFWSSLQSGDYGTRRDDIYIKGFKSHSPKAYNGDFIVRTIRKRVCG